MADQQAETARIAKLLRPWTICDDGGRFDHGSDRAARALLASDWLRERMAQAWDERDNATPQYLGPDSGHYPECMGWEDCYCASYPNPYRSDRSAVGGED